MNKDLNHLKLLGIFHTIWGVLAVLFGLLFGIVYIVIGANAGIEVSGSVSPAAAHEVFLVIGIIALVLSSIYGILMMIAGGKLRKQRGYGFSGFQHLQFGHFKNYLGRGVRRDALLTSAGLSAVSKASRLTLFGKQTIPVCPRY